MIKVAGFWNFGWTTPIEEFHLWNMVRRDFEVDEFIMCPVTGIQKNVTEHKDLQEVIDNNDLTIVFVDESGETWLEDFEHPKNVLYILGKTSFSAYRSVAGSGKFISVKIRTPAGKALLEPHQAISIVLYDRMLKQ